MKESNRSKLIFAVFFIIYCLFANYDSWNENSRLDLTISIVENRTLSIDPLHENTGDLAYLNGKYYTDKLPGSSILAIPAYITYRLVFINIFHMPLSGPRGFNPLLIFLVVASTSAFFSALTAVLVYKISFLFSGKRDTALLVLLAFGFGTIALSQATLFLGHSCAAFLSFFGFYLLIKPGLSKHKFFWAGLLSGAGILIDIFSIVPFIFCIFYILSDKTIWKKKNALFFIGASLISILIIFSYDSCAFGSPMKTGQTLVSTKNFSESYTYIENSAYKNTCLRSIEQIGTFLKKDYCRISVSYEYSAKLRASVLTESNALEKSTFVNYSISPGQIKIGDFWESNVELNSGNVTEIIIFVGSDNNSENFSIYYKTDNSPKTLYGLFSKSKGNYTMYEYPRNLKYTSNCPIYIINENIGEILKFENISLCRTDAYVLDSGKSLTNFCDTSEVHYTVENISNDTFRIIKEYNKYNGHNQITSLNRFLLMFSNRFLRLLIDPFRGLFFYCPILILSIIGLFYMLKKDKRTAFLVFGIFFTSLIANALWDFWWAGSTFGPRYLLIAIPFLTIPLSAAFEKIDKRIVILLIAISIFINVCGLQRLPYDQEFIFAGHVGIYKAEFWYNFLNWKPIANPLTWYYLPNFLNGGPRFVLLEEIFNIKILWAGLILVAGAIWLLIVKNRK